MTWRCFHCDYVASTVEEATLHFGASELQDPICQVGARAFREMERALAEYRSESDAASRIFYELGARHVTKLREEEERGYRRGLEDARFSEASGIMQALLEQHGLAIPEAVRRRMDSFVSGKIVNDPA